MDDEIHDKNFGSWQTVNIKGILKIMSTDPPDIRKLVMIKGDLLREEEIDDQTNDLLNNIGLGVYHKLENYHCIYHPNTRKIIVVFMTDDDITITISTCCFHFAARIELLFDGYPYKVEAAYFDLPDQRGLN
ncbi:MAG: hypothetical protein ICV84_08545 [Flavisolibacter sp.]|nr:hypothetical protein [Flavisolibacter sp.]MBD0352343.1 hypothetical protein [Flavisolibacter sp.]